MKPRIQCTDCGADIAWGTENCPGCGKPVDWPSEESQEEVLSESTGPKICPKCGTENAVGAAYCNSCGSKLPSGGRRDTKHQGKGPRIRKQQSSGKGSTSGPLFSWKVIAGFVGFLVVLVVVLELFFSSRQPEAAPTQQAVNQTLAPNMQLGAQITELEQQVAADPSDTQSLLKLANMCQDGRFFDKAITYYKRYLVKNPKDANARVDLGISYFENNDLDQAQKEMETALKYDPKHLQATFNLGIVNLKARRMKEASDWFKKTIELAPPGSEISNQAKQFLEQHSSPLIQNK